MSVVVSFSFPLNSLPPRLAPLRTIYSPWLSQAIVVRYTDDQEEVSNNSVSIFMLTLSAALTMHGVLIKGAFQGLSL